MAWIDDREHLREALREATGDDVAELNVIRELRDAHEAAIIAGDPAAIAAAGELIDLISAEAMAIMPFVGGDAERAVHTARDRRSTSWAPVRVRRTAPASCVSGRVRTARPRERRARRSARASPPSGGSDGPSDLGPLARLRRALRRVWRRP